MTLPAFSATSQPRLQISCLQAAEPLQLFHLSSNDFAGIAAEVSPPALPLQ